MSDPFATGHRAAAAAAEKEAATKAAADTQARVKAKFDALVNKKPAEEKPYVPPAPPWSKTP